MMTILLVRHGVAMSRSKWQAPDTERPLSKRGKRQADAIVDQLESFAIERVLTSPAVRCAETVGPLANTRGVDLEMREDLFEGAGKAALDVIEVSDNIVVCSHGDVLPELLLALAGHLDAVSDGPTFAKGATWVVERTDDAVVTGARYLGPPG